MIEPIRRATEEEIAEVMASKESLPINQTCSVVAMSHKASKTLAVLRATTEIDPLLLGEGTPNNRKLMFMWGLENVLRAQGLQEYFLNIPVGDEAAEIRGVIEALGAEKIRLEPQYRYRKVL